MKKTISVFLSIFILLSFTLTGCAAEQPETQRNKTMEIILQIGNPNMTVNGAEKPIDENGTVPVIINNRTLLPIRAVVEEMGGNVAWNGDTQTVTLHYNEDEIRLVIDDTTAYLNNAAQTLDAAPTIINDRTMLPIRFIAESFQFEVAWDQVEQRVTITGNTKTEDAPSVPAVTPSPTETSEPSAEPSSEPNDSKSLVVYFSATGTTKSLAEKIAATADADIFEIVPETPYTSADLNYNSDCRANREQNDENARPAIANSIENIDRYDTIFIGYPIWWGTMPKIINTFLETYDLSGKTIMPFCTSGGSGIETSVSAIKEISPDADVKDGFRGTSATSSSQIEQWISQ